MGWKFNVDSNKKNLYMRKFTKQDNDNTIWCKIYKCFFIQNVRKVFLLNNSLIHVSFLKLS